MTLNFKIQKICKSQESLKRISRYNHVAMNEQPDTDALMSFSPKRFHKYEHRPAVPLARTSWGRWDPT